MITDTRALGVALLLSAGAAGSALAQCGDGSPPPCPAARVAMATRPLNDRNWLILPFDNITRDQSLDVVRDASVTLLYSAMSQWSDILIVDDMRVADLMRAVPAGTRLGQDAAFELAKRVGAGRLVTGTLIKEGPRTRVQAAVFDVRSGRRLRSPSTMTIGTDSLSAVFASLARLVLEVPAPTGVQLSELGTQNMDALRAYVSGLEAERRLAQDTAVLFYRKAVAMDSAFGLAHYHLALTLGDIPVEVPGADLRALEAAQRFAAGLPRRERGQVTALLAGRRGDLRTTCELVDRMITADSSDAWAWFMHANCRPFPSRDSTPLTARTGVENARLADRLRAAALDSTFYLPVQAIAAIVLVQELCNRDLPLLACPDSESFQTNRQFDRDTIAQTWHRPYVEGRAWRATAEAVDGLRRMQEMQRDVLSRFLAANPAHTGAHFQLASKLLGLGDLDGAERELRAARGAARLRGWRRQYYLNRFYLELMRGRPALAAVFADSIYGDPTAGTQPQAGAILGRFSLDAAAAHQGNDSLIALRQAWLPVFAGVLPPDWDRLNQRYADAYALTFAEPLREGARRTVLRVGTLVAFSMRRSRPATDTAHGDPIYRFQAWFALGDTARASQALRQSDAELNRRAPRALDDGALPFNAESHVMLADSAGGLSRLRDYVARWPTGLQLLNVGLMSERPNPVNNITRAIGRTWLLYADLAMAAGSKDEARRGYQFVVDLWQAGEAPVQPLVARARAALATLR